MLNSDSTHAKPRRITIPFLLDLITVSEPEQIQ